MRRLALIATVAVLAFVASGCDLRFLNPPAAAPLRYRDQIFANVTKTADITYGSAQNIAGETVTLKMDEYAPTGDAVTSRPAIVWVHGGSFSGGDKTSPELVDESNTFAKKGFVNFSINYRLEPDGCSAGAPTANCIKAILEATADGQTAVKFLRTHASTYKLDPSRIAIAGTSAGAIVALDVGFGSGEDAASAVRAAVSLSGAQVVSAATDAGDAPSLLFHGTSDTIVPYEWAVGTCRNANEHGLTCYLTSFQGDGHVPYVQHRTEILDQTQNFLYWELGLTTAAR
jgi:carboxylesterase type B